MLEKKCILPVFKLNVRVSETETANKSWSIVKKKYSLRRIEMTKEIEICYREDNKKLYHKSFPYYSTMGLDDLWGFCTRDS